MPNNRELSQLGSYINVDDNQQTIGISTNLYVAGIISATSINASSINPGSSSGVQVGGAVTATSFVKNGGNASEFLKADGSSDSSTYITSVGIESSGFYIGDAKTINFTGIGNTFRISGTTVDVTISAPPYGGLGNKVFYENDSEVYADYGITTGKNAISAGPVAIATGITVTIPSGSTWTIV